MIDYLKVLGLMFNMGLCVVLIYKYIIPNNRKKNKKHYDKEV